MELEEGATVLKVEEVVAALELEDVVELELDAGPDDEDCGLVLVISVVNVALEEDKTLEEAGVEVGALPAVLPNASVEGLAVSSRYL